MEQQTDFQKLYIAGFIIVVKVDSLIKTVDEKNIDIKPVIK
jgi:hypothetical protein